MIAIPNSHLVLHKETIKNTLKIKKILIKHLVKITNLIIRSFDKMLRSEQL